MALLFRRDSFRPLCFCGGFLWRRVHGSSSGSNAENTGSCVVFLLNKLVSSRHVLSSAELLLRAAGVDFDKGVPTVLAVVSDTFGGCGGLCFVNFSLYLQLVWRRVIMQYWFLGR